MNISSLYPASYQPVNQIAGISLGKKPDPAGQAFAAINGSINPGSGSGTQGSFNDLKKLLTSAGSIGAANSLQNDFDALGTALASGDLNSARQQLTQLRTDVQSAVNPHRPDPPVHLGPNSLQHGSSGIRSMARYLA